MSVCITLFASLCLFLMLNLQDRPAMQPSRKREGKKAEPMNHNKKRDHLSGLAFFVCGNRECRLFYVLDELGGVAADDGVGCHILGYH